MKKSNVLQFKPREKMVDLSKCENEDLDKDLCNLITIQMPESNRDFIFTIMRIDGIMTYYSNGEEVRQEWVK